MENSFFANLSQRKESAPRRQDPLRELWQDPLREGTVPVREQPAASTLAGQRGPVVDLPWRYLPPPFSLGQICEKGMF